MTRELLHRFLASRNLSYVQWHDGDDYDLDALRKLDSQEIEEATSVLAGLEDWRDVRALDAIGTTRALGLVTEALQIASIHCRLEAADCLLRRGRLDQRQSSDLLAEALRQAREVDEVSRALRFAAEHPSHEVREVVAQAALDGDASVRVRAAATFDFLANRANSQFDPRFRQVYDRFASPDRSERVRAYAQLLKDIRSSRVAPVAGG